MYSIIDIETTGGRSQDNKITEIAIINFDGQKVEQTFSTLINPERNVPYYIERLTGISTAMVADAPKFYEVAKKIIELTEGRIFVAHNVHFDYNFIQKEFRELGYTFKREKLCTVRLARTILPGHKSYSLGNICQDLSIEITARHRALGDASATVELLKIMINKDKSLIEQSFQEINKHITYPPYLDPKNYKDLPHSAGVYYLWDKSNELLYIGKSKDIKKRVAQHFKITGKKSREVEFKNNIASITFKETGNELAALLWECEEIKKNNPPFNRALNKRRYPYAIESKKDTSGRIQLKLVSCGQLDEYRIRLGSKKGGNSTIHRLLAKAFGLDHKSIHFESQLKLFEKTLPIESWNNSIEKELTNLDYPQADIILKLNGRTSSETCYIIVQNYGINRIEFHNEYGICETLKISENKDTRHILIQFIKKNPNKILK